MDGWKSTAIAPYNTHQNRTDTDVFGRQSRKDIKVCSKSKVSLLQFLVRCKILLSIIREMRITALHAIYLHIVILINFGFSFLYNHEFFSLVFVLKMDLKE